MVDVSMLLVLIVLLRLGAVIHTRRKTLKAGILSIRANPNPLQVDLIQLWEIYLDLLPSVWDFSAVLEG